jgi:peptidoglycan/LPS O-acetylase OafA/YrhL
MERRFHTLDGLRGIAAIIVVNGHIPFDAGFSTFPFFYLAVDLFFLLSGFVIAFAYDKRFEAGLSVREFMLVRYIRLYPLYLIGWIIGAAGVAATMLLGRGDYGWMTFTVAALFSLLMLPVPLAGVGIAPLNGPSWSIFFELAVNLLFALVWKYLTKPVLCAIVLAGAVALVATDLWTGTLHGGFEWSTILVGLVRVIYGFFGGVLLYRFLPHWQKKSRWAYLLPIALIPVFSANVPTAPMIEIAATLVIFPAIIAIGAALDPPNPKPFAFLGVASYAIYILHEPMLGWFARAVKLLSVEALLPPFPWTATTLIILLLGLSVFVDKVFDGPVRKLLKKRIEALAIRARVVE